MTTQESILKELSLLRNDVAKLRQQMFKNSADEWISGDAVITLTGWDSKALRRYREQGLVRVKREKGTVRYSRESVEKLKSQLS